MATKPFDSTIISQANVLEASREYSVINKDLDGKILVLEQGRRAFTASIRQRWLVEANSPIPYFAADVAWNRRKAPRSKKNLCVQRR
jgi:hypothetical protein